MKSFLILWLIILVSCGEARNSREGSPAIAVQDTPGRTPQDTAGVVVETEPQLGVSKSIQTGSTTPEELLTFANSLIGTPYKYASSNPVEGFDCSGFITYVFNHFNIAVPRSSVDFTDVADEVRLEDARPGDLILFTGTDSTNRVVGHMGIINHVGSEGASFIHSSSGKSSGVVITPLNSYYMGRFVKVIRVFKQNNAIQ